MEFTVILGSFMLIVFVIYGLFQRRKDLQSLRATFAWCDAENAFIQWRRRNPGVYIGLSDEGRMLVIRWYNAYKWFLETHPTIKDQEFLDHILSLLNDLPPKPPYQYPNVRSAERIGAYLFMNEVQ